MENHFNCIYLYTNKTNGKKYVGQAVDFERRHKQHIYQSYNEKDKSYNQYFHNAIRRHGIENFEIEILKENLQNQEELNYWECYYIVEFDTLAKNGKGYNLASGGNNGNPLSGKTKEELAEISRKISEATKGENNPMYGKHHSEETRAKQSEAMKEIMKNKSNEELADTRKKQSEANKGKNKGKNPLSGKTKEELAEISRKHSEIWKNKSDEEMKEFSRKMSEINKGENNGMYGVHRYGEKAPHTRKIVSVDPFTIQPVFTWQYQKQVTEFYGISISTLNYYLKGKSKKGHLYNNFLWYYLDEWQQLANE